MNASIPLTYEKKQESCCAKTQHGSDTFSKPSHFAWMLTPVTLGVGFAIARDGGGSTAFQTGIYAIFLFGLGMALSILSALSKVQDRENT